MKSLRHMEDKWLNDIKDRLTDFEMEVPSSLWDSVNPENMQKVGEVKTKKRAVMYRMAAAAAILAIILTVGLMYFSQDDSTLNLKPYSASNAGHITPIKIGNPREEFYNLAEASMAGNGSPCVLNMGKGRGNIAQYLTDDKSADISDTEISGNNVSNQGENLSNADSGQSTDSAGQVEPQARLSLLDNGYDYITAKRDRRSIKKMRNISYANKFSIGLLTSVGSFGYDDYSDQAFSNNISGQPNQGQDNPGTNNPDTDNPALDSNPGNNNGEIDGANGNDNNGNDNNNNSNDEFSGNRSSGQRSLLRRNSRSANNAMPDERTDEISHHMPVKLGLTFLYRINDKIGVETGLAYTYLSSDVRYGNPSVSKFIDGTQSLHYIGVPVNVKYRPVHWRWADIYLSGGIQFDKCVSSSVNGRYAVSSSGLYAKERVSLGEKPFQLSANLSAGLQFNITPYLGIYVEPGISYYFNDGSSLSTFYKEHPWNFNINAGLRLSVGLK